MPASIEIGRRFTQATRRLSPALTIMDDRDPFDDITDPSFSLLSGLNSITLVNDGSVPVKVSFFDQSPIPIRDEEASEFTYSGTWTDSTSALAFQGEGQRSDTGGDFFVFNPGVFVESIAYFTIKFDNAAIQNIEVSDDGSTWLNPSQIPGIIRNDGVDGTGLNTLDTDPNTIGTGSSDGVRLEYHFPYADTWQIRVTNSGVNNGQGTGTQMRVSGGQFEPTGGATVGGVVYPGCFRLGPGESLHRSIRASQVHHRAEVGSAFLRSFGEIV